MGIAGLGKHAYIGTQLRPAGVRSGELVPQRPYDTPQGGLKRETRRDSGTHAPHIGWSRTGSFIITSRDSLTTKSPWADDPTPELMRGVHRRSLLKRVSRRGPMQLIVFLFLFLFFFFFSSRRLSPPQLPTTIVLSSACHRLPWPS